MKVAVYGADRFLLGEYEVRGVPVGPFIELTPEHEVEIWARRVQSVARDVMYVEALRSGVLHCRQGGPVTLEDGTPVTPAILRAMGWELDGDSWVRDAVR